MTGEPPLRVTVHLNAGVVLVVLDGEVGLATAPLLHDSLSGVLRGRRHVVVDLSGVTHLACSGLGCLVEAHARAVSGGGSLHLAGAPGRPVERVLDLNRDRGIPAVHRRPALALALELARTLPTRVGRRGTCPTPAPSRRSTGRTGVHHGCRPGEQH